MPGCRAAPFTLILLAACVAAPERGPFAGAERVLAIDFGRTTIARRTDGLVRVVPGIGHEARRVKKLPAAPAAMLLADSKAVGNLATTAQVLATDELHRHPQLSLAAQRMVSPDHIARRLFANLFTMPLLLSVPQHPLGEIDDREHRTDPRDEAPEASFWLRLRRRLLL